MTETIHIGPQHGPQEAFLACEADIAIYGGAAGAGKTYGALLSLAMGVHLSGYSAVAFRRTSPELVGGGSIWEESQELYSTLGGTSIKSPNLHWRFPSGALIEFRHLQHEDDVYSHQGKQYAQILFEELTHFEETQFWYLYTRARSTSGVQPMIRATCNPDPDSFVRGLIDWWIGRDGLAIPERSGVLRWFIRLENGELDWGDSADELRARNPTSRLSPTSLTFIPAKLDDNPALLAKDPEYRSRLEAMAKSQRDRLLGGNWNSRSGIGTLFQRSWFRVVESHPTRVVKRVRSWDKAASPVSDINPNPDWTRGIRWALTERDELVIEDLASIRGTPAQVFELMKRCAQMDGRATTIAVWQDPGQAGLVDVDATRRELAGYHVSSHRASVGKVTNAEIWSPLAERGQIYVIAGTWNEEFFLEADAFPNGRKDDIIDAASLGIIELGIRPSATRHDSAPIKPPQGFELKRAWDVPAPSALGGVPRVERPRFKRKWE